MNIALTTKEQLFMQDFRKLLCQHKVQLIDTDICGHDVWLFEGEKNNDGEFEVFLDMMDVKVFLEEQTNE